MSFPMLATLAVVVILLALVVFVVLFIISTQRNLVSLEELCGNALSQIGVQMSSRWDALTALSQLTKKFSQHEYDTLTAVIGARRTISAASSPADVAAEENKLVEAMSRLMVVAEAYPDLKSAPIYEKTMANVNEFENLVRKSRMVFNDTVTKFNRVVRQVPTNFVASMLHFSVKEYLEEPAGKTSMPSME